MASSSSGGGMASTSSGGGGGEDRRRSPVEEYIEWVVERVDERMGKGKGMEQIMEELVRDVCVHPMLATIFVNGRFKIFLQGCGLLPQDALDDVVLNNIDEAPLSPHVKLVLKAIAGAPKTLAAIVGVRRALDNPPTPATNTMMTQPPNAMLPMANVMWAHPTAVARVRGGGFFP